jgi:hypothetical protein
MKYSSNRKYRDLISEIEEEKRCPTIFQKGIKILKNILKFIFNKK